MAKRFRQSVIVLVAKNGTTIDEQDQKGTSNDCHPIVSMHVDAADCAAVLWPAHFTPNILPRMRTPKDKAELVEMRYILIGAQLICD